jgi:threonine synthase
MPYRAWFQCINGCPGEFSLLEVIYRCRKCNELLEVVHDEGRLARTRPDSWKALFDGRLRSTQWPYGSGV